MGIVCFRFPKGNTHQFANNNNNNNNSSNAEAGDNEADNEYYDCSP